MLGLDARDGFGTGDVIVDDARRLVGDGAVGFWVGFFSRVNRFGFSWFRSGYMGACCVLFCFLLQVRASLPGLVLA